MPRERTTTIRCAETGCKETSIYAYASQREYTEIMRSQQARPFKCTRHRDPEQVLGPDNLTRTRVLIASKVPYESRHSDRKWLDGLFWLEEGAERGGSGFMYGPGFKAHASDFPEGTRLVVTARIELPGETNPKEILSSSSLDDLLAED